VLTVQNVTFNRSTGMAEGSPAMNLEKRSSKALIVLKKTVDNQRSKTKPNDNLRWVLGDSGTTDRECT
jgi:hypothetical protein